MKNKTENKINIFYPKDWKDYELLDTGNGEKLEKFGVYTFIRPYEDAVWKKTLGDKEWEKTDGKFWSSKEGAKNGWKIKSKVLSTWEMSYKDIKFLVSPTPFRHLGFFPEQAVHWDFIEEKIKNSGRKIKFLNLFGYTGVASLFALRAGAEVTHVDASKQTLLNVKKNQKLSGLDNMPLRIILDDAMKFILREERRGNRYDCIIMDPPKFGRGPKGETWKIEKDLSKLLSEVRKILSDKPLFVILNSYAIDSSSLTLGYALEDAMVGLNGQVLPGELCLLEKSNNRTIPLSHTSIWSAL
jgi:23S rRNA (cytosine1962-C5)-methyltransferase